MHGHQDSVVLTVLPWDAWLNIEADQLAKTKVTQPHCGPSLYKLPGNPWCCYLGKQWLVKQFTSSLRAFINGKDKLFYWEQCKGLSQDLLQEVDWWALGKTMQSIPLAKLCWASKQMARYFAHGKNMAKWKQCTCTQCPWCNFPQEDKTHILKCPQDEASRKWDDASNALAQWLKDEQSNPMITQTLIEGLQAWRHDMAPPISPLGSRQSLLGWDVVLDGWLCLEWHAMQQAYWAQWRQKKSSK